MTFTIVGIDVATDRKKRFISVASLNENELSLDWVADGNAENKLCVDLSHTLQQGNKVLLAIDAPLGWPVSLGQVLVNHSAGKSLDHSPNKMFRRATDDFVKAKINKRPLDVGADRIARTAHAALMLINDLSTSIQEPVTLAWDMNIVKIAAIEVYPAATLMAHDRNATGYKGKDARNARTSIVSWLAKSMKVSTDLNKLLISNDNALDSAICVLAGRDFLCGNCYAPMEPDLAKQEGWIWVFKKQ